MALRFSMVVTAAVLLGAAPLSAFAADAPQPETSAPDSPRSDARAVIVGLHLRGGPKGSAKERAQMDALKTAIAYELGKEGVGRLDHAEIADGQCTFYAVGPDADRMFVAIEPILREALTAYHGYVLFRRDGQKALGRTDI